MPCRRFRPGGVRCAALPARLHRLHQRRLPRSRRVLS